MSKNVLLELLDHALKQPEVGAVNFNVLHFVLKTLIERCVFEVGQLPEGLKILEKEEEAKQDAESESMIVTDQNDFEKEYETEKDEEATEVKTFYRDSNVFIKRTPRWLKLPKRVKKLETQFKRIRKVIKNLGRESDDIPTQKVDLKEDKKKERKKKYTGLKREEFETAIEELGEAICRVSMLIKTQRESLEKELKDHIVRETCLKIVNEKLTKQQDPVKRRLKELALAIQNLQRAFKEVIYPEAAGVTECLTCGRKAGLSHLNIRQSSMKSSEPKEGFKNPEKILFLKENGKPDSINFTLNVLNKFQADKEKEKPPACMEKESQNQEETISLGSRTQRSVTEELGPSLNIKKMTKTFLPLRFQTMDEKYFTRNTNHYGAG